MPPSVPAEVLDWVQRLHGVVDELVRPLAASHGARLRCQRGCSDCCTDGLSVFAIEASLIERHHRALLEGAQPAPVGGCAFLDAEGGCRIYEHRPYVCRTQGLPLRWLDETEGPDGLEVVESRDVCPKNEDGGPALGDLPREAFWTLGPFEARLAARQEGTDGGVLQRVTLRALFASATGSEPADRKRLPLLRDR